MIFDVGVNRSINRPAAKEVSSRIQKRSYELAFGWKSEKYLIYAWILFLILSIILTFIVQNWTENVRPAGVRAEVGVSVIRLDSNRIEVMVISIEKDTEIQYLLYNTSHGSGIINRSYSPHEPIRDVGEPGIITVQGYDENVEIFSVLPDAKIKIFSNRV